MDREEEIANRIYSAIARILAARDECDVTVTVKKKEEDKNGRV